MQAWTTGMDAVVRCFGLKTCFEDGITDGSKKRSEEKRGLRMAPGFLH
jgi:hypothetical protein